MVTSLRKLSIELTLQTQLAIVIQWHQRVGKTYDLNVLTHEQNRDVYNREEFKVLNN